MGLIQSQEDISSSVSSNEIEISLRQVLNAFRQEIPILLRQHHTTSKTNLPEENENIEKNLGHHRSRSFNRNENKHLPRSSSLIKRKWQCHLCQKLNESDSQLCSDCGSSKINVYIPIMNQNQTSSTVEKYKNENILS
jgi:hypothetical protein